MKGLSFSTTQWFYDNEYEQENIDKVGKYGNSAIMKAAREARSEIVDELIKLGASLDIKNVDGNSALWNACFGESFDCVKLLVEAGIDINSQNVNGVTALMYCASAGKDDMVDILLKFGAKTDITNLDGFSALDLAVTPKIYKMLKSANIS